MAYQDQRPKGTAFTSLPSQAGDAHQTLVSSELAQMSAYLVEQAPSCASTALTMLRNGFPEGSVQDHQKALRIYLERLLATRI